MDPTDGSCRVTDTGSKQLLHLGILGTPVAAFTAAPLSGSAPLAVAFADESSGFPTSWLWEFGDGASSPLRNPTHVCAQVGSYTVVLTASNAEGTDMKAKAA
ncbi:MAG: PKD domain-containing protein [Gemmatimonadales bacterium]|nr:PKD domain-containing protein [Gemmatimonadales bacterium]